MTRRTAKLFCIASWAIACLTYWLGSIQTDRGARHAEDFIGPAWQRQALDSELAITDRIARGE